jgi:hypothetical protein
LEQAHKAELGAQEEKGSQGYGEKNEHSFAYDEDRFPWGYILSK